MKNKTIEFLRVSYLRGPNVWTYRPVIEAWVDIGELEDFPSNMIPGFPERLAAQLPSLAAHRCGIGKPGGFLQRLREGTWPAHIMEHVALELQCLAGMDVGFGRARETSQRGIYKVAVRALDEHIGRAAITAARDLVMAAIEDRPYDLDSALALLRDLANERYLCPSTADIVEAASERGIPWLRLNEGSLVQLGYGARQHRIWKTQTDKTSAVAGSVADDKMLARSLLSACGVPVPEGRIVDSPEDAWEAAEDIGGPLVVKPCDADHALSVFNTLPRREDIESAFRKAEAEGSDVMVERFVPGIAHRLLVVGGHLVAATRSEHRRFEGYEAPALSESLNGQHNGHTRRHGAEKLPFGIVTHESDGVVSLNSARKSEIVDLAPSAGQCKPIQHSEKVFSDCTGEVHPSIADTAALAARVVGSNIAGIDIVAQDISRPLQEQESAVVDIDVGPSLLMHLKPTIGSPQPIGSAILRHLFPQESSADAGRIPLVGITGSRDTTAISRLVAWLLHVAGRNVGLACADGLYLGGRRVEKSNCANWEAGQRLLINNSVEAAVIENGAEMMLCEGLSYDRCQVGIVTDVDGAEGFGEYYIEDAEQLYKVVRTQVDVVLPQGAAVLNAADSRVIQMAELCDGEVFLYAAGQIPEALVTHVADGGRAVYLRGDRLVMASSSHEHDLGRLQAFPCLTHASNRLCEEALLAGVAAAFALGLTSDFIVAGVQSFTLEDMVPAGPPALTTDSDPNSKSVLSDSVLTIDSTGPTPIRSIT